MKITFLGTNGWFDTAIGNTTCALIETKDSYIVLDAGGGFYKVKDIVKTEKPVYLFISHLHLDHIIGLHTLPLFKFPQGIDIYVPKGMRVHLEIFLGKPYTSTLDSLATKVRLHEIDTEKPAGLNVEFGQLLHSPICYGFRFAIEGKTITYCTDTGVCDELYKLAKGCDLLITECSFRPGEDVSKASHLNPEVAAKVAKESGVKRLALIHFDAGRYPTIDNRKKAEEEAKKIFLNTFAASEGQEIEFTSSKK
jgi:ribonuclease BN (tRNA processing enzyme)